MEIGITFPQDELAGDPEAVRKFCGTAEDLGYSHFLAFDHVLGAEQSHRDPPLWGPYDENDPFHDPIALFSYVAGRTNRIKFVTGVLVLPQRQTALVARQAADLAILSGSPIAIWLGGWADRAFQRAARLGDGFIFAGDPDRVEGGWDRLKLFLVDEGRSPGGFGVDAVLPTFTDPAGAVDFVARWTEAGGSHVTLRTNGSGFASAEAHVEYLAELAAALRGRGWLSTEDAIATGPSPHGET